MFHVDIELTDEGAEKTDDVIACFFAYIGSSDAHVNPAPYPFLLLPI